jgi:hypothetical protein
MLLRAVSDTAIEIASLTLTVRELFHVLYEQVREAVAKPLPLEAVPNHKPPSLRKLLSNTYPES